MKQTIFLILALTLWTACKKDANNSSASLTFVYAATECSDLWIQNPIWSNDTEYKEVIKNYLNNELGVEFTNLDILENNDPNFISCKACPCLTGRKIQIKSTEEFKEKLIAFGFVKQ